MERKTLTQNKIVEIKHKNKENKKLATLETIKHATFDQTNKKGSDIMDRKNLENTTFVQKSESELVLPRKTEFAATTLTEFIFL